MIDSSSHLYDCIPSPPEGIGHVAFTNERKVPSSTAPIISYFSWTAQRVTRSPSSSRRVPILSKMARCTTTDKNNKSTVLPSTLRIWPLKQQRGYVAIPSPLEEWALFSALLVLVKEKNETDSQTVAFVLTKQWLCLSLLLSSPLLFPFPAMKQIERKKRTRIRLR